ncbi:hypothetical protein ACFQRB_00570 [Halobaculum litoreum]|uniref:Uncharacterized protein n=1 Tax=Halobaculum litoreum TaxID=3031998 RepID=A0ABD5XQU9_9EURY
MVVGPGSLYQLFFLAASAVVVLLALSTYVLGRLIGHDRALGTMLALVGVFTGTGAGFGLPPSAAALPLALGFAFLYVPVGVGGLVAKGVSSAPWREVCRLLLGGWMAALVVALVTQAAGASLPRLIGWAPGCSASSGTSASSRTRPSSASPPAASRSCCSNAATARRARRRRRLTGRYSISFSSSSSRIAMPTSVWPAVTVASRATE